MENNIKKHDKRLSTLKAERSSFIPSYTDLSDYFMGYRGRFLTSDRNNGKRRDSKIFNNKGRMVARTLMSGMAAGITSPARPWFQLGAPSRDPDLMEYAPVKAWLYQVQQIIYAVFNHSNFYNSIHTLYGELGVFGTGSMGIYRDFNNVIWCQTETVGSYMLGTDGRNVVDTRYKEYELTVGALVKEFGKENCSSAVQQMWDKGNTEIWVKVVHAIEPNDDRDMMKPDAKNKKFRSVYYEAEQQGDRKYLRQSGFDSFPIVAPRWDVTGEDIYGTNCPGMDALGDCKALQLGERRKYQALDKVANPPLQGPPELRNVNERGSMLGSEILYVDQANNGLTSIYGNWRPDLGSIDAMNKEVERRISTAFYEDLFLMISNSDRRQITAREIAEKQEEKLLMLGPVLERLHNELLDPIVDRVFDILNSAGVLPPPPPELVDSELKVEYVSILAQAQRMVATTGIERFASFAGQLAEIWPDARHKVNATEALDDYAHALGVNPGIIRSDDEVQKIVQAEQQARQAQAQFEQSQQAAQMAQTASNTSLSEDNALGQMMQRAGLM